jgi:hypothetical protein
MIHESALRALSHHYKYGDNGALNRLVAKMPNSNRKVALLVWIKKFTKAEWHHDKQVFLKATNLSDQNLEMAIANPFWTLKEKQVQRRHVSGNTFEAALFFERVIQDIEVNINSISNYRLEKTIEKMQRILTIKKCLNDKV